MKLIHRSNFIERRIDRFEKKGEVEFETRVAVGEERSKLAFPRDFVGERWIKGSGELFLFFQAEREYTRKREHYRLTTKFKASDEQESRNES